jgi:L-threonylcarbamoyladenylate synthase
VRLAAAFWPGPLTLIVPASDLVVPALCAGTGRVAVRVPAHPIATALARQLGVPITSTSAKRSGRPPAATADEALSALGADPDFVVDGGASPGGPPSTIVDTCGPQPRLVRAGAIEWARVLESLSDPLTQSSRG